MRRDFIEHREAGFYIIGSRVPIDRIVCEYWNGEDAECIQKRYPTLTLEEVEGAIAFYLSHRDEVDRVIHERRQAEDAYLAAHPTPPDLKEKLDRIRRQTPSRRS